MHEIELKLQVPPDRLDEVEFAVAGRTPQRPVRLQAAYFDTADRQLASAALALRLRREGRRWVQTLKGAGDDGLTRLEHNVPRGAAAAMPALDATLHAGTPAGERLLALLSAGAPLQALYRTDIARRSRVLRVRAAGVAQAQVELAFDRGRIHAGTQALAVGELEIELLAGTPQAVIATARRWQPRHGLWIDLRSKAERGDLLARGERIAPARGATPSRLTEAMDPVAAWQAVLRNCSEQILANASQIASGEHGAEHVHQLRIGLRRLRGAIALFEHPDAALQDGATMLFRRLGAARDEAVVESEFGATLAAAMRAAGVAEPAPVDLATPVDDAAAEAPPFAVLRDDPSQAWLLDLLDAMQPANEAADPTALPLRERLAARLNRWHRQVIAEAKRYAELDDESRHRLRKRAKRLRYATEFCAPLFSRRAVRRYLKSLRAVQERLGAVSDAIMAGDAFARRAPADPYAMFALGWLTARREALVADALPTLKSFTTVERYWKAKQRRKKRDA